MQQQLEICTLDQLAELVTLIRNTLAKGKYIVLLRGELGSGKTALVQHYVQEVLGLQADSPTFSLVNTYENSQGAIHHFDLYRLESVEEIEDIGFWDYLSGNAVCFIEWPEKIAELLPAAYCLDIQITLTLERCRKYTLSY